MTWFVAWLEVGVEFVRVRVLSSSSRCDRRKDPKRLEGLLGFCRLLGLDFGSSLSILALELSRLVEVGLGSGASPEPSMGEPDKGLEEKGNG